MIVYAVVDDALSPDFPLGEPLGRSSGTRTLSGSSRKVRSDPELASETIAREPSHFSSEGPCSAEGQRSGARQHGIGQPQK
jgi:hypothetical protein